MLDCVLLEIKVKSNKALANGRLNLCMLDAQLSISTSKPGIPFSGEPSFNLQRSRFPDLFNSTLEFVYQAFRWLLRRCFPCWLFVLDIELSMNDRQFIHSLFAAQAPQQSPQHRYLCRLDWRNQSYSPVGMRARLHSFLYPTAYVKKGSIRNSKAFENWPLSVKKLSGGIFPRAGMIFVPRVRIQRIAIINSGKQEILADVLLSLCWQIERY